MEYINCQFNDLPIRCNIDFTSVVANNPYGYSIKFHESTNFSGTVKLCNNVIDCNGMFTNCYNFDDTVFIGNGAEECGYMFRNCYSFNHPVVIPDSVTNCAGLFYGCNNYDLPVTIGNNVEFCEYMFWGCNNFTNQHHSLVIPDSVSTAQGIIEGCNNFTGNIYVGKGIKNTSAMGYQPRNCITFPQNSGWFNSYVEFSGIMENFYNCFYNDYVYNKPFTFPNITENCSCYSMFHNCKEFAQDINVPDGVNNCKYMFCNIKFDGQTLRFGNNIKDMLSCIKKWNYFDSPVYTYNYIEYKNGAVNTVKVKDLGPFNIYIGSNCNLRNFFYAASNDGYTTNAKWGGVTMYIGEVGENQFNHPFWGGIDEGVEGFYHVIHGGDYDNMSSSYEHVGLGVNIHTTSYESALNMAKGISNTNNIFNAENPIWEVNGSRLERWQKRYIWAYNSLDSKINRNVSANILTTVIYF